LGATFKKFSHPINISLISTIDPTIGHSKKKIGLYLKKKFFKLGDQKNLMAKLVD
jgi:hypothetical protein